MNPVRHDTATRTWTWHLAASLSGWKPLLPVAVVLLCAYLCSAAVASTPPRTVNIVPLPVSIERDDGAFLITPATPVIAQGDAATEAAKLRDALAPAMGFRLPQLTDRAVKNGMHLKIEPALQNRLGDEGYELEVTIQSIVLRAGGPAGLFYGIQTLRELLPPAIFAGQKVAGVEWAVPCVRITD